MKRKELWFRCSEHPELGWWHIDRWHEHLRVHGLGVQVWARSEYR